VSEGLAQGPNVAARVGFKPATLWMQGIEFTTVTLHPTNSPHKVLLMPV